MRLHPYNRTNIGWLLAPAYQHILRNLCVFCRAWISVTTVCTFPRQKFLFYAKKEKGECFSHQKRRIVFIVNFCLQEAKTAETFLFCMETCFLPVLAWIQDTYCLLTRTVRRQIEKECRFWNAVLILEGGYEANLLSRITRAAHYTHFSSRSKAPQLGKNNNYCTNRAETCDLNKRLYHLYLREKNCKLKLCQQTLQALMT